MVFLKLVCSCSLAYNTSRDSLIIFLIIATIKVVVHSKAAGCVYIVSKCSQYRPPASVESGNAVKAVVGRITKVVGDHTVGFRRKKAPW